MRIALLFGILPDRIKSEITENTIGVLQNAADILQRRIIEGLFMNEIRLTLINFPFIGYYPFSYKKSKLPSTNISISYNNCDKTAVVGYSYGFRTDILLKNHDIENKAYKALKQWLYENPDEDNIVIIYSVFEPFIKACKKLKIEHKLRCTLIVPDLPEYMGESRWLLRRLYIKYTSTSAHKKLYNLLRNTIDGYILLTDAMRERLPIENKPWAIVEGIAPFEKVIPTSFNTKENPKIVLYSGTLDPRYGITKLLDAFSLIKDDNIQLHICGEGSAKERILQSSDSRIVYHGQVPYDEVLSLQRRANLLVNPRSAEGEFTKYSFPSKTMEYLSSGVPTLMYRLPGIPSEYYPYFYCPEGNSVIDLSNKMAEILNTSEDELKAFGESAKVFIQTHKTPKAQTDIIISLLQSI